MAALFVSTACQRQVKPQSPASAEAPVVAQSVASTTMKGPPPKETPSPTPAPNPLAAIEKKLLREAERAFREKNYTTPTYNNAYDKFQSVLLINSRNDQARAGLQAILLRYAGLIRHAMEKGRLRSAENYMAQVELYYPANSLLIDLKKQILEERQRRMAARILTPHEPADPNAEEIPLAPAHLNAKSPEVIDLLSTVAKRLRQSNESIMIFARNDREGRWIYKQLKQSAEGYRVRGDIRIARKPKLHILPPL